MVEEIVFTRYKCECCETVYNTLDEAKCCENQIVKKMEFKDLHGVGVDTWNRGDYIYDLVMCRLYLIVDSANNHHVTIPVVENSIGDIMRIYHEHNAVLIHKGVFNKLKDAIDNFKVI